MTMLESQITSLTVVYSIVYTGVHQRKHQSSASLAFVREIHRGPVNFPHKWPVTRKMFPFDDVIMCAFSSSRSFSDQSPTQDDDVIMTTMAAQITSLTVVYSTVYSDANQRKHQSSASLAFVWGIQRDRWIPRTKGQLRGKCFHLMTSSWSWGPVWWVMGDIYPSTLATSRGLNANWLAIDWRVIGDTHR